MPPSIRQPTPRHDAGKGNDNMITVGIDIGKEKHAAAILGAGGRLLAKPAFFDNTHDGAKKLWAQIARHGGGDGVRVGMEATGNCWKPFRDFLAAKGATVDVINPIVTSASMAGDVRGRKTDKQDAVAIAGIVARGEHAARRPEGEAERDLKCLTRQRRYLVSGRSGTKNRLRDQLLESFPEFPALFKDLFSRLPLALLGKWPGAAELARARKVSVAKVVKANSRGKDAGKEAARIIAAARDSICFAHPPPKSAALCIRSTLRALRDLDASIEEIDAEIQECERPEMARLMEGIKGAGKTMPMVIASEFGGFERFEASPTTGKGADMAKRMLAFAGCEPRIRESGKWKGKTKVSKRGSGQLRLALYLAANAIRMNDDYFRAVYDEKIKTKHHSVALFYVIRKLLEVLCSLHRSGREYSPTYAGRSRGQPVAIG